MPANIIDGKEIASKIEQEAKDIIRKNNLTPSLIFIVVGDDPATMIYVKNKQRACERVGISSSIKLLNSNITEPDLINHVKNANTSDATGIVVQLPLPKHISEERIISYIRPDKDVDCCNPENVGRLFYSSSFMPCTVAGIMRLIEETGTDIRGKNVTIINRGHVGKALAIVMANKKATVVVCGRNSDIKKHTSGADIVVSATGTAGLIKKDMIKPGAIVIDVGISRKDGKIKGDVEDAARSVASYITPVPGGVGPMTVAMLMKNTAEFARK